MDILTQVNEDITVSWKSGQSRLEQYFAVMRKLQPKLGQYIEESEPSPGYYAEWFQNFVLLIKELGSGTGKITHFTWLDTPIEYPYMIRSMPLNNFDILGHGKTYKMQRVGSDIKSIRDIMMTPTKPILSELSQARSSKGGTLSAKKKMLIRKAKEIDKRGAPLPQREIITKDSDIDAEGDYKQQFLLKLKPGDVFTHPHYDGHPQRGLLKLQVLKYPELDNEGEVHGLLVRAIEVQQPSRPRREYVGDEKKGTERLINKDYGTDIDQGEVYFYGESFKSMNRSEHLIAMMESLWSGKVKSKWHPPEGLFASCDSEKIANEVARGHTDLRSAVGSIEFYKNRAGKNLSKKCIDALDKAVELLHSKYK